MFCCKQVETPQEEQDTIYKIKACVEEKSNEGNASSLLMMLAETCLSGFFSLVCTDFVFAISHATKWDLLTTCTFQNQKIPLFQGEK